jgi:hypothetical protein
MAQSGGVDRREFTLAAALAALSGVTITISACGGGGGGAAGPSNPTPPLGPGDKAASSIGGNHGHIAVITAAQLTAAAAITLDIRGQGDHPHTLELSNAEIAQVAASQRVSKVSSVDDAHNHVVTFN